MFLLLFFFFLIFGIFFFQERGFTLDPKDSEVIYFKRIEHLLLHYYKNDLPNCDVKLGKQFK